MTRLLVPLAIIAFLAIAKAKPVQETPETPPGDICQTLKGPHPKKDVEIQPYCPDETPTPEPTPKNSPPKSKPEP